MACIVITVSSPYHYAMKARKPQSPKRESAATSGMGLASMLRRRLRLNTHDGQNLPLGMPAGIVCYLAGHIWLESAHTPIAGGIPINKEDP